MVKIVSREQLLNLTDRFEVLRYLDGRIDKINCYRRNTLIHTTQALYSTINDAIKLTGANGFLFNEVWNSLETTEQEWYDRNPICVNLNYQGMLRAIVGSGTKWTYTVPAGKKAFLEIIALSLRVDIVEAAKTCRVDIFYQNNSTQVPYTVSNIGILTCFVLTDTLNTTDKASLGQNITLQAEDVLTCVVDCGLAGAGQVYGSLCAKLTEFDA